MNKMPMAKVFKDLPKFLKKHSPEILTGVGIAGMILTTISAVRATPKALRLIDKKEVEDGKRLSTKEIVKTTWKCYIPPAITGICSVACLIGANSVSTRRNAALATAYAISVQDLTDYKNKTLEMVGEKKETAIRDEIAKDKLEKAHVSQREFIVTGRGETPCYEPLTDRLFKSDIETLRRAENILNKRMRDDMVITVNEFFTEIGLDPCDEAIGERLGWTIEKGYIDLHFTSKLVEGIPYLVIGHNNAPEYLSYR